MDTTKTQDTPKKCFCARCFLPVDEEDKVEVEGQKFHRVCSTCCICRTIPKKLKMFYGHVFCAECFKKHVLTRFRENAKVNTDSWWMQFAPGVKAQDKPKSEKEESKPATEESPCSEGKKSYCARCLQPVDDSEKLVIGGQCFHPCCAKCCACQEIPKDNMKIYYGQVFCEDCFNKLVLHRSKDNTAEFFKCCFEQWQTNPKFAANVKSFMESSTSDNRHAPTVFIMQGSEQSCRRDERVEQPEWFQNKEPKKCECAAVSEAGSLGTWDYSFEARTERSGSPYSSTREFCHADAEKIEKLTKYLREIPIERTKKMQNSPKLAASNRVGPRPKSSLSCPKCLWQWGTIFVNRAFHQQSDRCVENFC